MKIDLPMEDSPYQLQEHGPVFILGCPRSGTTFLSQCLAAIDGLEEFVGILAPPRLMHQIGNPDSGMDVPSLLLSVQDIFWQSFWRRLYYKDQKLIQLLRKNISVRQFFEKPSLKNSIFCYKEPFLCFAAKEFSAHFSKAKFIHIIRDGRDNADSMDRKYKHALSNEVLQDPFLASNKVSEIGSWRNHDGYCIPWWIEKGKEDKFIKFSKYERNVLMWREMVTRARELKENIPDRYFEIRYEDFVQNPMIEATAILKFLEVDLNRRIEKKLKKAFSTSVGISKSNIAQDKRQAANEIAGSLLTQLNYSL